mmetsp:Transcript_5038/g.7093  ORF Transcript_5038/g.7093 Transcript_5038/m.7093 type:complete len:142 (+) Transcript_5038:150-575(+)
MKTHENECGDTAQDKSPVDVTNSDRAVGTCDNKHQPSPIIAQFRRRSNEDDIESMMKAAAEIGEQAFVRRRESLSYMADHTSKPEHDIQNVKCDVHGLEDGISIENIMMVAAEIGEISLNNKKHIDSSKTSREYRRSKSAF